MSLRKCSLESMDGFNSTDYSHASGFYLVVSAISIPTFPDRDYLTWCRDKDSDITWLYGPLKSSRSPSPTPSEAPSTQAPRKPSLKRKPSIWELPEDPSTSNDSTDGKSLLGRFWNITIHSVPSVS